MLHYDPQHVSSSTLLILRRTNCITTASGIVTLSKQPYCMQVESGLQSGTHLHTERTYTHQMLCCRITILAFTSLTNFKISNFNKEHMSSLKTI